MMTGACVVGRGPALGPGNILVSMGEISCCWTGWYQRTLHIWNDNLVVAASAGESGIGVVDLVRHGDVVEDVGELRK